MTLLITVLIFSALIVIHEFGHFLAARFSGVRVEKFAIGFGPALLKIRGKETDFLICVFPLGGYVKLAGDSRTEHKGRQDEFLSQPPGVRMRIVFAGPLFNYLLAFVLFCTIAFLGFPYQDSVVGEVLEGFPAQKAGLQSGDRILAVNNQTVDNWTEMAKLIYRSEEKVELTLQRNGETLSLEVPLQEKEVVDDFGRRRSESIVGIAASSDIKVVQYGFPQAILKGAETLLSLTFLIVKGFILMIAGVLPFRETVAGPVGIFFITSEAVKIGIVAILQLAAVLNVSLAIINLVPVPVLDGGHLLFFLVEKVRGRPLEERTEDILTRVGLGLICLLICFVFYNDIIKFGPKIWSGRKNNRGPIVEAGSLRP